jgi:hypothetical protein
MADETTTATDAVVDAPKGKAPKGCPCAPGYCQNCAAFNEVNA